MSPKGRFKMTFQYPRLIVERDVASDGLVSDLVRLAHVALLEVDNFDCFVFYLILQGNTNNQHVNKQIT